MTKKVAVCMIVKQESKVIKRCFDSFVPYISAYIINDNGSTDGTQDIITDYFAHRDIPGKIHHDKWVNFAHNRSLALDYGRKFIKETLKEPLEDWYLLMVDADYILNIKNHHWLENLKLPNYSLRHTGSLDYTECILFRADKPWKYECVTHEYPCLPGEYTGVNVCDDVTITHYYDGGSRSDKFERDIRLLTEALADKKCEHQARYTFYLARSYEDTNDFKNAIKYYELRVKEKHFPEEIYYSLFKAGVCKARIAQTAEDREDAVLSLLKAYNYRPSRVESLYEAAEFYIKWNMIEFALPLLEKCLAAAYPKNDILMIHRQVYEWQALYLYTRALAALNLHQKKLYHYLCMENTLMPEEHKKFITEKCQDS